MNDIFDSDLNTGRASRQRALKLYFEMQADADSALRFKQTDLSGSLFSLFVDVQSTFRSRQGGKFSKAQLKLIDQDALTPHSVYRFNASRMRDSAVFFAGPDSHITLSQGEFMPPGLMSPAFDTATFLLSLLPSETFSLVLEGAPGQGKSTLGQYICQLHRLRILDRGPAIADLPLAHRESPLRLPFRIDLRDLATWMQGHNPFGASDSHQTTGTRTVETFVAASISDNAGGSHFTVDDFYTIIDSKDVFLYSMALMRSRILTCGLQSFKRLEKQLQGCQPRAELQTLVTSRPAAFANSPGFPEDSFVYLTLVSLPARLIKEYAEKWVVAKALEYRHANEVTTTLDAKLSEPHIRDLA